MKASSIDLVSAAIIWLLVFHLFGLDDDVARIIGEFSQQVVAGFNGG